MNINIKIIVSLFIIMTSIENINAYSLHEPELITFQDLINYTLFESSIEIPSVVDSPMMWITYYPYLSNRYTFMSLFEGDFRVKSIDEGSSTETLLESIRQEITIGVNTLNYSESTRLSITKDAFKIDDQQGITGCYPVKNGNTGFTDEYCYTKGILTGYTEDI